jgi:hypothetical protein
VVYEGRSHTGLRILVVLSYFDEDVPLNAKSTAGVEHKKSKTHQEELEQSRQARLFSSEYSNATTFLFAYTSTVLFYRIPYSNKLFFSYFLSDGGNDGNNSNSSSGSVSV